MTSKLLRWFLFAVVISLVPLLFTGLTLWGDDKIVSLAALWPHGELLLISTAIAAEAIGGMIPTGPNAGSAKIVSTGACTILLFISALWYAVIQAHPGFKADKISESSLALFALTLVAALCCKALAER
jgi:hypothetical protein